MKKNETDGGELGPPPAKITEKWDCPLLCGKTFKTGTKTETVNAHIEEHSG